jgi:hypothetical protein
MLSKTKELNTNTEYLDLSILSEPAKQELQDFYQFLLERYGRQQSTGTALPHIFYNPIRVSTYQPFKREEIYDAR